MADEKNFLVVIHGIGEHTETSVKTEVSTVLEGLSPTFAQNVEVRAIAYNQVFNDWIEAAKSTWNEAIDSLASANHMTEAKKLLKKKLGDDEAGFLQTHALDVVLYLSTVGVKVQLEVAGQLLDHLQDYIRGGNTRRRRIAVMGHSMGTAVLHDTLHKLIAEGFETDRDNTLADMALRINSIYQVANTSRLLKTRIDPTSDETSVRPHPGGIIDRYYNVHHRWDPIPQVKPFEVDPRRWIPESSFPDTLYKDIELKAVVDEDVHSLTHYLSDPRLHMPLLFELDRGYQLPRDFRSQQKEYERKAQAAIEAEIETRLKAKARKAKQRMADSVKQIIEAFLDSV